MGRRTFPNWMIWVTELRMMSTGTANPTPLLAPDGEYIAVLMPAGHSPRLVSPSQQGRARECPHLQMVCSRCWEAMQESRIEGGRAAIIWLWGSWQHQ